MSVYNGGTALAATLDSVLAQEGVAFEFIVVDDGSTDGSGALLDDHAQRDERLRVIHQDNRGLTRALIRGCAAARGPFIARQDAGDRGGWPMSSATWARITPLSFFICSRRWARP